MQCVCVCTPCEWWRNELPQRAGNGLEIGRYVQYLCAVECLQEVSADVCTGVRESANEEELNVLRD